MRIIYLDFETYYATKADGNYSLRTLTTEQYLRDERFQTILLTAMVDDGPEQVAWGHNAVAQLLRSLRVDAPDAIVCAHNARFDASIIEWKYGVRCNFVVCSILLMRETGLSRITGESLASLSEFLRERGHDVPAKGFAVSLASGQRLEDMVQTFRDDYEKYCGDDVRILRAACKVLLPLCTAEALRAMDMSLKMYMRPVIELDTGMLDAYLQKQIDSRKGALEHLAHDNGFGDLTTFLQHLRSKPKFAELLRSLGVNPPMKVSEKKSAKAGEPVYDYAFAKADLDFIALTEHHDPRVAAIVEARLGHNSSINESRTRSFLELSKRGPMPVPLEYARAHTGRYGGSDKINLQNLPKRGGDKTLRYSMRAPAGYLIGGADSSQVEARLLAYVAGQEDLVGIFARGEDPYCYMASSIYNIPYDVLLKDAKTDEIFAAIVKRNVGKETVLGAGYGMSGNKFADRLKEQKIYLYPSEAEIEAYRASVFCPPDELEQVVHEYKEQYHLDEARRIVRIYRKQNSAIKQFWRTCENVIECLLAGQSGTFGGPNNDMFYYDGQHEVFGEKVPGIRLPNGFWLLYYRLHVEFEEDEQGRSRKQYVYAFREGKNFIRKKIYGGALTENLIQAIAFAVLKWQAIRINAVLPVRLNVHDEWMSVFPIASGPAAKELYMKWMAAVPSWCEGLPLACEFKASDTYGGC